MPERLSAHITVGEPTYIGPCPRCRNCCLFRAPLTAILPTGVQQAGAITACAECDSPARAVREHIVAKGWR